MLRALRIIAHEGRGMIFGGFAKSSHDFLKASLAKAHSFIARLKFAVEQEWTKVVVEGDSIVIVNKLELRGVCEGLTYVWRIGVQMVKIEMDNITDVRLIQEENNDVLNTLMQHVLELFRRD
ncbi:hypothetical protein V6N11_080239 [Hibiscus sabdariffa]|uniref:RNase H type-1 domain-containing protein n=1 Tax=Hibiscus sabdariffa TaxID=183260 RepID=A0ABR2R739_9ROSI